MGFPFFEIPGGGTSPPPPPPPATIPPDSLDSEALDSAPLDGWAEVAADFLNAAVGAIRAAVGASATVHAGFAGPRTAMPYVEVQDACGPPDFNSEGGWIAFGTLTVRPRAAERDAALLLRQAADAALSDAPLTFRAGRMYYLRPAPRSYEKDDQPASGGDPAHAESRTYSYGIQSP